MALDAQGNEVGKLFVGGLHQSTNTNGLHNYFSKFGDIEESIVMMDNKTGRSRGFGYVKFKEPSAVDQVLSKKVHVIDNKEVDPKRCNINMRGKNKRSLKIFVGGIAFEHDEEIIRSFFQCYGNVTDVNLLSNPGRPRHRGFAFVGFDDEEVVKRLIKMHYVNLHGKQVEIKPMEPPNAQKNFNYTHPGALNAPNGRPIRGNNRFNSFHQNNMPFGGLNHWGSNGDGGRPDLSNDGNGWNPVMAQQHQGLQPAWNSPSNHHQWNGPTPPSPNALINSAWENQMAAAAAAAAFQPNGFTSSPPQHQPWGPHSSSGRRGPPESLFRGDNGGILDPTLMDYNSWNPSNGPPLPHHQRQQQGGPSPPSNHFFPSPPSGLGGMSGDPFSRRGDETSFTSAWNTAIGPDGVNQWSGNSMNQTTLWSSATTMRDQNNSNGIRLAGSTMGLNPGPDSSAFRLDEALYRVGGGGSGPNASANGLSTPTSMGILGQNDGIAPFSVSETPVGGGGATDWQSLMAVAAAQQRSMLVAASAASQIRR
ncbi:hypothetical protein Aperf_G00000001498 [Anoplocephala perfoliata]